MSLFGEIIEAFTLERADGSSRTVSGYKYAEPQAGTKKYSESRYQASELPPKVDLRKNMTAIENQGNTMSCVANAVAGAYEYLAKMHTGENYDVSRMFIYYNGRYVSTQDESNIEDNGSYIQAAIQGLKEYGACSEETYPFDTDRVNEVPYQEAYDEATQFLVEDMALVPTDLNAWKSCLAEGYPIIFGISLYQSFDKQRKRGMVPMPSDKEAGRESHGGHAMLAVGYSDKDQVFIVRNSWGEEWGDNGYCYIPYDYLVNPKFNDGDSWIIRQLQNVDFNSEEYWDESDESVIGDYDSELANMSDEDYEALLDAMGDYPLEYRIALLFLYAAGADGEISDEEYDAISEYMEQTIDKLGVDMSAKKILRNAVKDIEDFELIQESVALMGEYLSTEMLAKIVSDLEAVIGVDGLSEDEGNFLYELIEPWQIEHAEAEESEEEDEETEVDDDEEEEEEDEDVDLDDVFAYLEELADESEQDLNWQESVVDLLKLLEFDSSLNARKEFAEYLGCPAKKMSDSAQMNMWLHKAILQALAENGCEVPEEWYE